jgi:multidrug efflux pump subunit AcrA (membrane-fusion protein)
VVQRDGKDVVLSVRNDRIVEVPVRTGGTLGDRIVILEGLSQGEEIIQRPEPSLVSGTKVKTQ